MREQFLEDARRAIRNPILQRALDQNAERRARGRSEALRSLPDIRAVRSRANAIRTDVIKRLPEYLRVFTEQLIGNGWKVHHAATAAEACQYIIQIAQQNGTHLAVKSKSMVTEEIKLNRALIEAGIKPIETDLGEFIVQLRNEPPGHIITPAIHLLREDVAETFVQHLGIEYTTDVSMLNQAARSSLRGAFFQAGIGISGVNFGVADHGTICLVTNEGNGRMVTSLPRVHIAVMGIERLVPSLDDLAVMLQLLPRFATGQVLSSYVSLIRTARRDQDLDGPESRHIILVDNGRFSLRHSRTGSALLCIRCGACLNVCPVYREIGGHTYASVYPGPIGSVVSPALFGLERFGHLARVSTLCGACREACPVDIDLPTLLLHTRDEYIREVPQPTFSSMGINIFRWVSASPRRYRMAQSLAGILGGLLPHSGGWLTRLPPPLDAWTISRDFPPFHRKPFRARFMGSVSGTTNEGHTDRHPNPPDLPDHISLPQQSLMGQLQETLTAVDAEMRVCYFTDLALEFKAVLGDSFPGPILIDPVVVHRFPHLAASISGLGIRLIEPSLEVESSDKERLGKISSLDAAAAGVTLGIGALADSGTVILGQDGQNAATTSLFPRLHIAIVPKSKIFSSMADWFNSEGEATFKDYQSITLITGPSRTADIEMTLTIGVHGPERLIVLVIDDQE